MTTNMGDPTGMTDNVKFSFGREERLINLNASRFEPLSSAHKKLFATCQRTGFVLPIEGMDGREVADDVLEDISALCEPLMSASKNHGAKLKLKLVRKICKHEKLRTVWCDPIKLIMQIGDEGADDATNVVILFGCAKTSPLSKQTIMTQLCKEFEKIGVALKYPELILSDGKIKFATMEGCYEVDTKCDWFEPVLQVSQDDQQQATIMLRRMYVPKGSLLEHEEWATEWDSEVAMLAKTDEGIIPFNREEWGLMRAATMYGRESNHEPNARALEEAISLMEDKIKGLRYKLHVQKKREENGWQGDELKLTIPCNEIRYDYDLENDDFEDIPETPVTRGSPCSSTQSEK